MDSNCPAVPGSPDPNLPVDPATPVVPSPGAAIPTPDPNCCHACAKLDKGTPAPKHEHKKKPCNGCGHCGSRCHCDKPVRTIIKPGPIQNPHMHMGDPHGGSCCGSCGKKSPCGCQSNLSNHMVRPIITMNQPKPQGGCGNDGVNCSKEKTYETYESDMIWPVVGGTLVLPVCDSSAYTIGQCAYFLPDLGWMEVTGFPGENLISVTNPGHSDNVPEGSSVVGPVNFTIGTCPKPDIKQEILVETLQDLLNNSLPDEIQNTVDLSPCWTTDQVNQVSYGRFPLIEIKDSCDPEIGSTEKTRCLGWQTLGLSSNGCMAVIERASCNSDDVRFAIAAPNSTEQAELFGMSRDNFCDTSDCLKPRVITPRLKGDTCEPNFRILGWVEQEIICEGQSRTQKFWRSMDKLKLPESFFYDLAEGDAVQILVARKSGNCCEFSKLELEEGQILVGGSGGSVTVQDATDVGCKQHHLVSRTEVTRNPEGVVRTVNLATSIGTANIPACATHVMVTASVFSNNNLISYAEVNGYRVVESSTPNADKDDTNTATAYVPLNAVGDTNINYILESDFTGAGSTLTPGIFVTGFYCEECL